MTLDEWAEIANLSLARSLFPAATDAESLKLLREECEKVGLSSSVASVDEQQNSAEG